ncbi:MAG: hypothetical protein QOH32_3185 [Bradyrhizobium sp.]|jgi:hypothetical protein|nr:hypothetical protein [Bradyrhizobium sp.]
MSWRRLGQVYAPDGARPWACSHAALPVPVRIGPDSFRFFFSTRDAEQRSHVGWVDLDIAESPRVLQQASEPVLAPGEVGAFDDSGIGLGCLTDADDRMRLYYMGWNLGVGAPWRNAIGLASAPTVLDRFERFSAGPIMDRSPEDPYTLSYPWVLRLGADDWWMWYGSNLAAHATRGDMKHVIKAARSRDGVRWQRDGATVIGFATPEEYAIARPTVVRLGDRLLMCFACRGERYRIGAACSTDGRSWLRLDTTFGLAPSASGWDSEMTCYPALFWHRDRLWLAYNGNGYGRTGFGLAVWEGSLAAAAT